MGSEGGTAIREAVGLAAVGASPGQAQADTWLGTDCAFHADLSKCPLLITRLSDDSF